MTQHRIERSSDGHRFWRKTRSVVTFSIVPLLMAVLGLSAISEPAVQHSTTSSAPQAGMTDWKNVEQALGKAGTIQPDGVYKVSLPRSDLQVTVDGIQLK